MEVFTAQNLLSDSTADENCRDWLSCFSGSSLPMLLPDQSLDTYLLVLVLSFPGADHAGDRGCFGALKPPT